MLLGRVADRHGNSRRENDTILGHQKCLQLVGLGVEQRLGITLMTYMLQHFTFANTISKCIGLKC